MFVRQIRQIGTVQKCLINLSKNVNEIKKEVSQTGQLLHKLSVTSKALRANIKMSS